MPRKKPRPRRSSKITFITMRRQAKSWVEKKRRMTVPITPEVFRVAIICESVSDSSFL